MYTFPVYSSREPARSPATRRPIRDRRTVQGPRARHDGKRKEQTPAAHSRRRLCRPMSCHRTAFAPTAKVVRSRSDDAVTHSWLGTGPKKAVHVDLQCGGENMAETCSCSSCSIWDAAHRNDACSVASMSILDSHTSGWQQFFRSVY